MAFENQPSNASPPCAYVTAPTSPNEYTTTTTTTTTEFYYSAPVSPLQKPITPLAADGDHHPSSNLDDFEFETSKKFSGHLHFDSTDNSSDYYYEGQDGQKNYRDPLPAMAFADELFLNGLVMPLKLPPRLQYDSDCNSYGHKSSASSPSTVFKTPFARKSLRNDGFDPFMAALQKVREDEKRGKNSRPQRRSRSYSPFRAIARCSSDCTYYVDRDFSEENSPTELKQVNGTSFSGPLLDFKGSAYARWVRDQTGGESLRSESPRRLFLEERVSPLRNEPGGLDKKGQPNEKCLGKKHGNGEESKVQKVKGFLLKCALFGRGNKPTKLRSEKKKYYSRLGFKSKGKC